MAATIAGSGVSVVLAASGVNTILYSILDSVSKCNDNLADCGQLTYYIRHIVGQCQELPDKYLEAADGPLKYLLDALLAAARFARQYSRYWRVYRWARADHIRVKFARHFNTIDRWRTATFQSVVSGRFITHAIPSSSDSEQGAMSSDVVSL